MVRSRRVVALSAFVVLLLGTVTVVAMPPPGPVCTDCASDYRAAANETGVAVRVAESAAVVHLHENGSATWVVGLRLTGPDADQVLGNESLHGRIARDAAGDHFADIGRGSLTHVSGDPVAVGSEERAVYYRYHDGDFAEAGVGGTLVSTHFRQDFAVANYNGLGVDRLTVEAPGMQLTRAPPSATTVSGLSGSAFTLTSVDQTVVTFSPDMASSPLELLWMELLSMLAVAALLLPVVAGNATVLLLPALLVHTLFVGVLLALVGRLDPVAATERARRAVAGLFGVAAVAGLLQPLYAPVVALPGVGTEPSAILVGLGAAGAVIAVGLVQPERSEKLLFGGRSPPALGRTETLAVTAVLAAAAGGALAGWALAGTMAWNGLGLALTVTVPTAALLPATAAALDGRLRRGMVAIVVGFLVGGFAAPALYSQPQGVVFPGFLLAPLITGALLAVGWPCLLAGWALADREATAFRGRF